MKNNLKFAIAALSLTLFAGAACAEDVVIVVNKSNPIDNVTTAQLRKMMLGEQAQWASGKQVMVLLRNPGSPERDVPLQVICGMNDADFTQHFMHASFNGGTATQPKSLGSAAMLRQLASSLPGAIGFVAPGDVNDAVKVIKLDGHAPGDADYKLKK